ncbi:hypothetical protein RHSIM_Rhsim06G0059800 [Rhododendron simsii]|uniref:Uncharacterized protein n=1 Tax=Rhododendron simsii TaxID=118357 RepID=A0A834GYB7_RHOSS|nr:hypothetical protein RHSIM_Rhsim06G0059800 [Rhododendron simsii]
MEARIADSFSDPKGLLPIGEYGRARSKQWLLLELETTNLGYANLFDGKTLAKALISESLNWASICRGLTYGLKDLRLSDDQPLSNLHVSLAQLDFRTSPSYIKDPRLHPTDDTPIALGMPLNFLGLGAGGGCGVGLGLGWGFGTAFGSQYRSSRVMFQGIEFTNQSQTDSKESTNSSRISKKVHGGQ